jgi:integrase
LEYKKSLLKAMRAHWSPFDKTSIGDLNKTAIRGFKLTMLNNYGPTLVNGIIMVLREMLAVAVLNNMLSRAMSDELLEDLSFATVDLDYKRHLGELPCHADLLWLKVEVEKRCRARGEHGHWLFSLLLLLGCRVESTRNVHWADLDWDRNELYFRKAKYGTYSIPLFPEL